MLSIRSLRQTAWVVHPHYPELRVFVEKPTRAELMEERHKLDSYSVREVAVNPMTKEPIRDNDGNLEIVTLPPRVPLWETTKFLTRHVKKVEGVEEADAPIEEIVMGFLKEEFDVTEPVLKDGKPAMKDDGVTPDEVKTAFAVYLFNKVMTEGTFKTPDPTVATSSSQQISA